MAINRTLYISGRTVTLFTVDGRHLVDTQAYGHDEDGLAAFSQDLKSQPPFRTRLLVDITEEEFRVENLPHVFGTDQQNMLNRKLVNLFRETRFRQAQKQGREEAGRRDDIFMISGITNPEMLNPWLDRLLEEHVPVPSIHSLSMLHQELFRIVKPENRYVILISQGEMSGMRQTFFIDGKMKVSRLTPTRRLDAASYLELAATETNRFWNYITSTRLAPEEETVHATLLGDSEFNNMAGQYHLDNPFIKFHFANIDSLITKNRFKGIVDSSHGDEFFSLLLANTRLGGSYATPAEKRFYYHFLASRTLVAGAAAAWLYVLFTLPLDLFDGLSNYQNLTLTLQQQQRLQQQYQRAINTVPPSPTAGPIMESTVNFYQQLNKLPASPIPYMKIIGQQFLQSRDMTISELNWGTTVNPDNFPSDDQQLPVNQQGYGFQTPSTQLYPVLLVTGTINTHHGIRQAVGQIDNLRLQMMNTQGIQDVEVLTYPLEIDPEKTLSSGEDAASADTSWKKFSLRIVWEPVS